MSMRFINVFIFVVFLVPSFVIYTDYEQTYDGLLYNLEDTITLNPGEIEITKIGYIKIDAKVSIEVSYLMEKKVDVRFYLFRTLEDTYSNDTSVVARYDGIYLQEARNPKRESFKAVGGYYYFVSIDLRDYTVQDYSVHMRVEIAYPTYVYWRINFLLSFLIPYFLGVLIIAWRFKKIRLWLWKRELVKRTIIEE